VVVRSGQATPDRSAQAMELLSLFPAFDGPEGARVTLTEPSQPLDGERCTRPKLQW
jgi:hypothetical protein